MVLQVNISLSENQTPEEFLFQWVQILETDEFGIKERHHPLGINNLNQHILKTNALVWVPH